MNTPLLLEINIAVLGCKSSTKNQVLNTLFGDTYLPVDVENVDVPRDECQAIIDSFRIIPRQDTRFSIRSAESVIEEIVKRRNIAKYSKLNPETLFDIQSGNKITGELRDDTTFVFINLPDTEGKKRSLGEAFFWKRYESLDNLIVIVNPTEDNEEDIESLVRIVTRVVKQKRAIPVTIFCAKAEKHGKSTDNERKIRQLQDTVQSINARSDKDQICDGQNATCSVSISKINILSYDSDEEDPAMISPPFRKENMIPFKVDFILVSIESESEVLIQTVRNLVGTAETQTAILKQKLDSIFDRLSTTSSFTEELFSTCYRYKSLEEDSTPIVAKCVDQFWKLFQRCEDNAIKKFESEMDPARLSAPIEQLFEFRKLMNSLNLDDEKIKLETASKRLLKRQLQMILHKFSLWSFDDWYNVMNENNWKRVAYEDWSHVSPTDWNTIMSSLLLTAGDHHFYESFGKEKIQLERARYLSNDRIANTESLSVSKSFKFSAADGCPSLEHSLDGCYERGRFRPKYPTTFDCVVRFDVPDKLSNKRHWGHLSWKHCSLMRSLE